MARPKPIDAQVFYELGEASWVLRRLTGQAIPIWLRRFELVWARGDCGQPRIEVCEDKQFKVVVGGIDVLRPDPDDLRFGVAYNKDHYVVTSGNQLLAHGPFRDGEHWLRDIPQRLKDAQTLEMQLS